ncbi:MAG: hypothetical protein ACK4FL_02170 [Microgenomates group bacterium]
MAVEACMGGLYDYLLRVNGLTSLEPKREEWLLAGLIHDIDYSGEFKKDHPKKISCFLCGRGLDTHLN